MPPESEPQAFAGLPLVGYIKGPSYRIRFDRIRVPSTGLVEAAVSTKLRHDYVFEPTPEVQHYPRPLELEP